MELFATGTHFIVVDGQESLWIDRNSGSYVGKNGCNPTHDPSKQVVCLGTVYGFIGQFMINPGLATRLVFIRQRKLVGEIRKCNIFSISSVALIPMEHESEVLLEPCLKSTEHRKYEIESGLTTNVSPSHVIPNPSMESSISQPLIKVKVPPLNVPSPKKCERQDKVERQLLDDFQKMFTEADSFYYSVDFDITTNVQRQEQAKKLSSAYSDLPLWEKTDRRFFWNYHMLENLISSQATSSSRWILPVMQGFIQERTFEIEDPTNLSGVYDQSLRPLIQLWIFSRRSRFRAGTRYLRRGIDENGKVANYVETEQVMIHKNHVCAFTMTRGSVPVFWSQETRYRYRPAPKLERLNETHSAFCKHIEEEIAVYENINIINLVERNGKESVLGDAFVDNILRLNSPDLVYVSYDFHEATRGMRFKNVELLIQKLDDMVKSMGYTWKDQYGVICEQKGVFRVNCVDCLDRTNVVQTQFGREVLYTQLSKLGLIMPEEGLPRDVRTIFYDLWANNGDTISKQYAGTNALKGDFTRTGERKFTGVMKDGMNSANRYYVNRFRDHTRQALIDLMLGTKNIIDDISTIPDEGGNEKSNPEDREAAAEQMKVLVDDTVKDVVPPFESPMGGWGLVNSKTSEPGSVEVDTILILTEKKIYITEYDWTSDSVAETSEIDLQTIKTMVLGYEAASQAQNLWGFLNTSNNASTGVFIPYFTLNYAVTGIDKSNQEYQEIVSFEFRSSNIRFFSTIAVPIQDHLEMQEALRVIAETIRVACETIGNHVPILNSKPSSQKQFFKPRIPNVASSLVNKYLVSNPQERGRYSDTSHGLPRIFTPSIDRYFRRGSASSSVVKEPQAVMKLAIKPDIIQPQNEEIEIDGTSTISNAHRVAYPDLIDFSLRTPVDESYYNMYLSPKSQDLVLASCGILYLPMRRKTVPISPNDSKLSSNLLPEPGLEVSPLTPVSDLTSPGSLLMSKPTFVNTQLLQRHRYSLPTNTLLQPESTPVESSSRSKTPEITITEETQTQLVPDTVNGAQEEYLIWSSKGAAKDLAISKRICRSYEDVNSSSAGHPRNISSKLPSSIIASGFKLPNLLPLRKSSNRGGSQQDITDSVVSMKGSHSDNALRENPFQSANTNQKKETVLAPLGKLARGMQSLGANYLDPRKLRDSFKPVAKRENIEDPVLEEMKKQCKTLIIEI